MYKSPVIGLLAHFFYNLLRIIRLGQCGQAEQIVDRRVKMEKKALEMAKNGGFNLVQENSPISMKVRGMFWSFYTVCLVP